MLRHKLVPFLREMQPVRKIHREILGENAQLPYCVTVLCCGSFCYCVRHWCLSSDCYLSVFLHEGPEIQNIYATLSRSLNAGLRVLTCYGVQAIQS